MVGIDIVDMSEYFALYALLLPKLYVLSRTKTFRISIDDDVPFLSFEDLLATTMRSSIRIQGAVSMALLMRLRIKNRALSFRKFVHSKNYISVANEEKSVYLLIIRKCPLP
jgi:hypothetical protein